MNTYRTFKASITYTTTSNPTPETFTDTYLFNEPLTVEAARARIEYDIALAACGGYTTDSITTATYDIQGA